MDQVFTDYINDLVNHCLANPALASQKENLENYFYGETVDTLIDNLNDEQMAEIKNVDPASEQFQAKMQLFASQIPGFMNTVDEKLRKEAEDIKQSGVIPTN